MATISLCMIVKNEEDVLGRCLESVRGAVDEIIVVDTGSSDRTKEIARAYTQQVYDFVWIDDFAAARNFSFSKANMEYCMWLDADDILLEEDNKALIKLKKELNADTVMLRYHVAFDQAGRPTFSYYRERILKRSGNPTWVGAVHEVIPPYGSIQYCDIAVTHKKMHPGDADRNLRIFETMLAKGVTMDARQQFYYGRELYYHAKYEKAITVLESFLKEGDAWIENKIDACSILSSCYESLSQCKQALAALFYSMQLDVPRAEICCEIGKIFLNNAQYPMAIYWYQTALECKRQDEAGGFVQEDCYGYIPYLQLCVCYDRIGQTEKAREYNQKAGECKPGDEIVKRNEQYFSHLSIS
jgi:glycosyltransferase involved in cell wall biosynthesis